VVVVVWTKTAIMVFFHFGRSKDARGDDYFIYLGHKPKYGP
jgi:hypothetical protein